MQWGGGGVRWGVLHFNLIGYVGKNKTCIGNVYWKLYANLSPKLICVWEMNVCKETVLPT